MVASISAALPHVHRVCPVAALHASAWQWQTLSPSQQTAPSSAAVFTDDVLHSPPADAAATHRQPPA
jgi:hypothetical protein